MKRKDMKRSEWRRILERDYRCSSCCFQGKKGISSVLILQKVSEPLTIHYEQRNVTIAQEGDTWLQLAFRESYVWVTAMYDRNDQLLQIYFDITNGSCFEDETNPTFEDLYLDLVLEADGAVHVLDEDELKDAFLNGEISEEQYDRALQEGEKLYRYLQKDWKSFAAFCYDRMMELKGRRKDGQN